MSTLPTISGLLARVEPGSGAYKDSGRTQPAALNGDVVLRATDQTGNATSVVGTDVTLSLVGGVPWFSFNATTSNFNLGKPSAYEAMNDASLTVVMAVQTTANNDVEYQTIVSKTAATGASKMGMMLWKSSNSTTTRGWVQATRNGGGFAGRLLPNVPHILTYRFTRTGSNQGLEEWRADGTLVNQQQATLPVWDSGSNWRVGSTDAPGVFFKGLIGPILMYSGALSDAQCVAVEEYARVTVGAPVFSRLNASSFVVFSGNSLMDGAAASSEATSLPVLSMALRPRTFVNLGMSGTAISYLAGLAPQQVDTCRLSGTNDVLVFWEITNSLTQGLTAAQAYSAVVSYCEDRRAAGWTKIIVMSCMPRATIESAREATNALLRADFTGSTVDPLVLTAGPGVTYADVLYDAGNDPTMGQSGQSSNTTYYVDGIHPTDAGYVHLTPSMHAALAVVVPIVMRRPVIVTDDDRLGPLPADDELAAETLPATTATVTYSSTATVAIGATIIIVHASDPAPRKRVVSAYASAPSGYSVNRVPQMTSNTAPSGTCISGGNFNSTYAPYQAFDRTNADSGTTGWVSNAGSTGWVGYTFPAAIAVTQYTVTNRGESSSPHSPNAWTFEGSNDLTTWTTLDTQSDVSDWNSAPNTKKTFAISNVTAYSSYRLNITDNDGSGNVGVGEMEMMTNQAAVDVAQPIGTSTGVGVEMSDTTTTFINNTSASMSLTGVVRW